MWGTWRPWGILVLAGWLLAGRAGAQERSVAEELFRQGRSLLAEGEVARACAKFEESQRLDPATGTLLNLAVCHEQEGKLATAWSEYREALDRSRHDGRSDRVEFAESRLESLEPRLARLMLRPPSPPLEGLVVYLDDTPLNAASLGVAFPVDSGPHELRFSAPGYVSAKVVIDVASGAGTITTDVPTLDLARAEERGGASPPPVAPGSPRAGEPGPVAIDPQERKPASARRTSLFVATATGALALSLGAGLGIAALDRNGKADCNETSCATAHDLETKRQAHDLAAAADVALLIGGVSVAVAVTLWLLDKRKSDGVGLWQPSLGRVGSGIRF